MFLNYRLGTLYYTISVADENIAKADCTSLFGLFEVLKIPFGLWNGSMKTGPQENWS